MRIKWLWDKLNTSYWLSLGIVLAGTLVTYWYSVFHMLRSEILVYFLHAGSNNSVASLISNNLNSTMAASDTWLFRPLGSAILAVNKVYLGFNPLAWHILSLVLFMVVVWCLFRLLWEIRPGILAMLMALFFATMYASVNAVLYSQLMSYLVFIALVLSGLFYLYRGVEESRKRDITIALAFMFVSCFLYEMGIVLIVLSGLYIWLRRRQLGFNLQYSAVVVGSVFLVFLLVYGSFKLFPPTTYQIAELGRTLDTSSLVKATSYILFLPMYWVPMIVLPSAFQIFPVASLETQSAGIGTISPLPLLWIGLNVIAIAAIGYFAFPRKADDGWKFNNAFPLILGMAVFIYVCLVALYRGTDIHTGILYVLGTNITMNMFLAWTIPLGFCFVRPKAKHVKYVALALLFLVCISASKTFTLNYNVWEMEQPYREYVAQVDNFVQEHKDEQGFSFLSTADDAIEENFCFNWPVVHPSGEVTLVRSTFLQVKYYQYWNVDDPQWVLTYDSQERRFTAINVQFFEESSSEGIIRDAY